MDTRIGQAEVAPIRNQEPVTDFRFIASLKCRPILWDSRLEEYKNCELKNAAWIELAEELGITADKAKTRAASLRSSLARRRRAIKDWENAPSGSAARKKKKPTPYKYAAEMSFLTDVMVSEATTDNLGTITEDDGDLSDSTLSQATDLDVSENSDRGFQPIIRRPEGVKRKMQGNVGIAELTTLLTSASESIKSLGQSSSQSSPHKRPELDDEDYLCAMQLYNILKVIPPSREKEMGRVRLMQEALTLKYSVAPPHPGSGPGSGYVQQGAYKSHGAQWIGHQVYSGASSSAGSGVHWQGNTGGSVEVWPQASSPGCQQSGESRDPRF